MPTQVTVQPADVDLASPDSRPVQPVTRDMLPAFRCFLDPQKAQLSGLIR